MSDDLPAEELNLSDGTALLYRKAKFMHGTTEFGTGDHLIVNNHQTGDEDDVVVINESGELKVKRLVQHLEISTSSPAVPATSAVTHSFADVDADTEKRLLAIYRMFER